MKQLFARTPVMMDQPYCLDESQAHHLFDVLRTSPSETVRLVWNEEVYLAHPEEKPYLFVFGKEEVRPRLVDVTLCCALIKQDKWEWMLQKAAELGVSKIVPFSSERTVVMLDQHKEMKKLERWSTILESACKQCNRADLVMLEPVQTISTLQDYKSQVSLTAYEKEGSSHHLANYLCHNPESLTVVIGPEGGFTDREIEQLSDMGFGLCSLGNSILRAETAACYVLSCVEYQTHLKSLECES